MKCFKFCGNLEYRLGSWVSPGWWVSAASGVTAPGFNVIREAPYASDIAGEEDGSLASHPTYTTNLTRAAQSSDVWGGVAARGASAP